MEALALYEDEHEKTLFTLIFMPLIFSCREETSGSDNGSSFQVLSSDLEPDEIYVNPDFSCPSANISIPTRITKQYSYEHDLSDSESLKTIDDLEAFCLITKQIFTTSDIKNSEADELFSKLNLHNSSFGMPGPEDKIPKFDHEKNASIRRTSEGIEIFYRSIGCGVNYDYSAVVSDQAGEVSLKPIEIWSESFSC